jgi:hypothetical protein
MDPSADSGGPESRRVWVDRWEGDLAVVRLDDGTVLDLPRWMLPPSTLEGDVLLLQSERTGTSLVRHTLQIDLATARAARAAAESILTRLRLQDPGDGG